MRRGNLLGPVVCAILLGCGKLPAPPAPSPPAVNVGQGFFRVETTSLTCLSWPSGKAVVVWADIDGDATGTSVPSPIGTRFSWRHREIVKGEKTVQAGVPRAPEPPMPPQAPQAPGTPMVINTYEETGRGVGWECETADGVTGTMLIGNERFDLADGNVFLVRITPGGVTQLTHDFTGVDVSAETFTRLAVDRPEIKEFIAAAEPAK